MKKRQRRLTGVGEMMLSLSAKGLTHGEISGHLAEVSKQTISMRRAVGREPGGVALSCERRRRQAWV